MANVFAQDQPQPCEPVGLLESLAEVIEFSPETSLAAADTPGSLDADADLFGLEQEGTDRDIDDMLSRQINSVLCPETTAVGEIVGFGDVTARVVLRPSGVSIDFAGTDLQQHAVDTFSTCLAETRAVHARLLGPALGTLRDAAALRIAREVSPTSTLAALAANVSRINSVIAMFSHMLEAPSLASALAHDSTLLALCGTVAWFEPAAICDARAYELAMKTLRFVDGGVFLSSKGVQATQSTVDIAKNWNELLQRALFLSSDPDLVRTAASTLVDRAAFAFLTPNSACTPPTPPRALASFSGHLGALLCPENTRRHAPASRVLGALRNESNMECAGEFPAVLRDLVAAETKYHAPGAPLTPAEYLGLLAPQLLCHAEPLVFSDQATALKVMGMLFSHATGEALDADVGGVGAILRKMCGEGNPKTWREVLMHVHDAAADTGADADIIGFLMSQLATEVGRISLHLSQHAAQVPVAGAAIEQTIRRIVEMTGCVWGRLVTAAVKEASQVPLSEKDACAVDAAVCAVEGIVAVWKAGVAHRSGTVAFCRLERQAFVRPFDADTLQRFARVLPTVPTSASVMKDKIMLGSHLLGVNPDNEARAFEHFASAPSIRGTRSARQTRAAAHPRKHATEASAMDGFVSAHHELATRMDGSNTETATRKRPPPPKAVTSGTAKAHVYLNCMEDEYIDAGAILEFGKRCVNGGADSGEETQSVVAFRRFEDEIEFRQMASAKKGLRAKTQLAQAFSVFNKARWQRCTGCVAHELSAPDLFPGVTQAYMSCVELPGVCSKIAALWGISEHSVRFEHLRDFDHAFGTFHATPDKPTHMGHGWSIIQAMRRKMRAHGLYSYHKNIVACLMESGWEESLALALCMRDPSGAPYNTKACSSAHGERYYTMIGALAFQDCVLSTGSSSSFPLKSPTLPQPGNEGECGLPLGRDKKRKVSNDPVEEDEPTRPPPHATKITGDTRPCKKRAPNSVDQLLFMRMFHTMTFPIAVDSLGGIVVLAAVTCLSSEHAFHTLSGLHPVFMACDLHRVAAASEKLMGLAHDAISQRAGNICCGRASKLSFRANPATGATEILTCTGGLRVDGDNFNNPVGYSYLLASATALFDPSAVKITERDIFDKTARGRTSRVNPFQAIVNTFTDMACTTRLDIKPGDTYIDVSLLSASRIERYRATFGDDHKVTCASLVPHVRDFMGCVDGSRLANGDYLFAAQTAFAIYRVVVLKHTDTRLPKNFGAFTSTLQHRQSVRSILADMIASDGRAQAEPAAAAIAN